MLGIPNEICGNLRRGIPWVKSGILVAETDTETVHSLLSEFSPTTTPQKPNTTRVYVNKKRIHIYAAKAENYGAAILYYTGPEKFRKCICSDARSQGLKLSVTGLWQGKQRIAGRTEEQIFACLGLDFIPPDRRRAYTTKRAERNKRLRKNSINERKAIFKSILSIFANRQRGGLPVKRTEIMRDINASWLTDVTFTTIVAWMQRHGLVTLSGTGYLPNKLPTSGICWTHGKALPCYVCRRIQKREEAMEIARRNRESRNRIKEAEDVVLGICGSGN